MVPVSSALASPGGLLDGKALHYGLFSDFISKGTSLKATDNITNTSVILEGNTKSTNTVWYDFESPKTIKSYLLETSNTPGRIYFYDKSNAVIASFGYGTSTTLNLHGTKTDFSSEIRNVSRVAFANMNTTGIDFGLYQIDFFEATPSLVNPTNLTATAGDSKITLSWTTVTGATGYNVKRSTVAGGPYTTVASNVYGTTHTDTAVVNGTKYYYVVTAIDAAGESGNSNEASATPQGNADNNRAILTVTLNTGLEKEFDLAMSEVKAFIEWYELKAVGAGSASFALEKHDNNKGPFKSRKDYVVFDKILTFEVNEYDPASE